MKTSINLFRRFSKQFNSNGLARNKQTKTKKVTQILAPYWRKTKFNNPFLSAEKHCDLKLQQNIGLLFTHSNMVSQGCRNMILWGQTKLPPSGAGLACSCTHTFSGQRFLHPQIWSRCKKVRVYLHPHFWIPIPVPVGSRFHQIRISVCKQNM